MTQVSSIDIASSVWNTGSNDVLFQLQQAVHTNAPGQAIVTLHGDECDRSIDCLSYLRSIDSLPAAQVNRWPTDQHVLYAFVPERLSTSDQGPARNAQASWLMGEASDQNGAMKPRLRTGQVNFCFHDHALVLHQFSWRAFSGQHVKAVFIVDTDSATDDVSRRFATEVFLWASRLNKEIWSFTETWTKSKELYETV